MKTIILILGLLLNSLAFAANKEKLPVLCEDAVYHQFDFWLGQWEVRTADGKIAGNNTIIRSNRCLVLESWKGLQGGVGTSVNYYDPERKQWVQHWVSESSIIHIYGVYKNNSMILDGTITYIANAKKFPFRGTWTLLQDGRVRQFFEQKTKKKWTPWFEGFYKSTGM